MIVGSIFGCEFGTCVACVWYFSGTCVLCVLYILCVFCIYDLGAVLYQG